MRKKGKRSRSLSTPVAQHPTTSSKLDSPEDVVEFINHLPDEQREQVAEGLSRTLLISQKTFIGPLPHPDDFAKYDQVMPGAANRIMSMAEKEQQIRADSQDAILFNDRRRINGATLLGIALVAVAGIATWQGYTGIALSLGLSGVISALFRQLFAKWNSRTKSKQ